MNKIIIVAITLLSFSHSGYSLIFEADSTEIIKPKLSVHGYVDIYYSYNFNDPENADNFGETGVGRIFDGYHNQFALGLAQTKLNYQTSKSNIVLDLVFGPNAELANFGNIGTSLAIKQAYISTAISEKFTLTIGQFGTHIGYELVDAPDNFNYSLSYLFGNGPFYHTGLKVDYAINDKISVMGGILNGWDSILDNNKGKSIAAQLSLSPIEGLDIYINWIGGDEMPAGANIGSLNSYKQMSDLTTTYNVNEKLTIGINAAFGSNEFSDVSTTWGGGALYINYRLSDLLGFGFRGEYFDDTQNTQYLGTSYQGLTFTTSISPNENIIIKPELRIDNANDNIYYNGPNNTLVNSQQTFGIAIIGKF